jgi:hypothetical protein
VVSLYEDGTAPTSDPVHRPGEASGNRLHAASQRIAVASLHDEVRVVGLQRVVHEPKVGARTAARERPLDFVDDRDRPQRGYVAAHAKRDVRR